MKNRALETDLESLVPLLLGWWDEHKADRPWRWKQTEPHKKLKDAGQKPGGGQVFDSKIENPPAERASSTPVRVSSGGVDPYAIWVAEVMLQQTQVSTVITYYLKWMDLFPSINHLATASLNDVLKCWQGLGYYGRARNLHRSARLVVADYGGHLPESFDQLVKLPGIGRYTAGAIASIAFGQKVAAVDGNVVRVISRLVDYPENVTVKENKEYLWSMVGQIVPKNRPGDFNVALMELGQRICHVKRPHCHQCPLTELCLARVRGTQLERPVRPKRAKIPHYHVTAAVIKREDGRILITRRPLNGLLGGLWEFPGGKVEGEETLSDALLREINEELGVEIFVGTEVATIKHAYTHFRITLHAFGATLAGGEIKHLGVINHAWVTLSEMDKYAFAATDLKIIEYLWTIEAQ